ncbi:MAG: hypothetical protein ACXVBE_17575, partial [Bdellovibrionota bacterium]
MAKSVTWAPISEAPPSLIAGSRKSAFYVRSEKKIYLVRDLPLDSIAALPQLELHELFGALGFNDHRYTFSTALTAIAEIQGNEKRADLAKAYGKDYFQKSLMLARSEDGGSSVSGGGDLDTLAIKLQVLKLALNHFAQNPGFMSSDFLQHFPDIGFEPMDRPDVHAVAINYQYRRGNDTGGHGSRETFTLYVPMSRTSTVERSALIDEIGEKILAIFPTEGGGKQLSPNFIGCRLHTMLSFPESAYAGIVGL